MGRTWTRRDEIRKSEREQVKKWNRSRKGGKNVVRGYDSFEDREKGRRD